MTQDTMSGSLIDLAQASPALGGALGVAVGFGLGMVYFGSLWWNARAWIDGGLLRAAITQILRFALVVIVFFGLAKVGAVALLCGALGLLAARALVLRRFGRPS